MQNTAYLILKGQNRKSQKLEFTLSLHFSEASLISFGVLNNGKLHCVIRNVG